MLAGLRQARGPDRLALTGDPACLLRVTTGSALVEHNDFRFVPKTGHLRVNEYKPRPSALSALHRR